MNKKPTTPDARAIVSAKPGEHFYSDKPDRYFTAVSHYYGRKIVTERLIVITTGGKEPQAKYITKVTVL